MLPKWIVFQLTKRCNLRCEMCYEWGRNGSYEKLDKRHDLDYKIIEQIITDTAPGKPKYEFFGGEPLLYADIFKAIVTIKKHGCKVDFPSNGFLLEKYKEDIVESGLDCIWVSLDGPREINDKQRGKGVFDKALKGITAIQELKKLKNKTLPKIGITFVITKNNFQHVSDFFINELDIRLVDYINIEFQRYITGREFDAYSQRIKSDFNSTVTSSACGYVQSPDNFSEIDFVDLSRQLNVLKEFCLKRQVPLNITPNITSTQDIEYYYTARWNKISVWENNCLLPWLHVEISANGDVTADRQRQFF